jgi:hypothetical protein
MKSNSLRRVVEGHMHALQARANIGLQASANIGTRARATSVQTLAISPAHQSLLISQQ